MVTALVTIATLLGIGLIVVVAAVAYLWYLPKNSKGPQ